jgi:CheY-like chemotaxis protein
MEILNDILDLSRMESGKTELKQGPVNLKSLINEIRAIFSLKISEKKLEFITEIDPGAPSDLLLDRIKLKQVLLNLLGNAVKFTHKGHVKLSVNTICRETDTSRFDLVFTVEDTGIGIPEEEWESVFEPFTQQEGQSQTEYGGAGLGLSISRKITRAMGGDIRVSSSRGEGSRFTVTLENVQVVSITADSCNTEVFKEHDEEIFNGIKILVVDDNYYNREVIKLHLQFRGLMLYEAENGKEAVEVAATSRPDIMIIDMNMPVMNGLEAIEIIRNDDKLKNILIILLSASTSPEQEKKISGTGTLFLKKPATGKMLRSTIVSMLKKVNMSEEVADSEQEKIMENTDLTDEESAAEDGIENIPELIKILEGDMFSKWQNLDKGIMVKQGIAFSRETARLGREHNRRLLREWGEELEMHLRNLNFTGARETIGKYPVLIESLKKQSAGKS